MNLSTEKMFLLGLEGSSAVLLVKTMLAGLVVESLQLEPPATRLVVMTENDAARAVDVAFVTTAAEPVETQALD